MDSGAEPSDGMQHGQLEEMATFVPQTFLLRFTLFAAPIAAAGDTPRLKLRWIRVLL